MKNRKNNIKIRSYDVPVYVYNTIVVGTGAAGLNCADLLAENNIDVAIVTEGINMGTSRNTGSDKQTYYKLTVSGNIPDSVYDMAKTLYDGGSMHGDLALIEAANSLRSFFRLTGMGVPFPFNEYGEYAGYKTDHDPRNRATSCGPLTSYYMTEALERKVREKNIPIFDGFRVIEILTENGEATGLLAVNPKDTNINKPGLTLFSCVNVIYATGGPSAIYASTVYPESQTCAHGAAFRAGAEGVNLTESQYGIASINFRWNLSGTFQQVIPRYISTKADGVSDPAEFLGEAFNNIFYKGYEWPFDPRKLNGSSSVDMAIYRERLRGRRVFLDYTRNPEGFTFNRLSEEARTYLLKSGATQDTPVRRLRHMNNRAYELFLSHGIDLEYEFPEIDVCTQHNNGGLAGDIWYESNIKHFFPVGEVCGVFGVYRPGGSALNSTQVSSLRASQRITLNYNSQKSETLSADSVLLDFFGKSNLTLDNLISLRRLYGERMSMAGAFIRNYDEVCAVQNMVKNELENFNYKSDDAELFLELTINYDILITQYVYLSAIREYIENGGKSRGSYLINGDSAADTENSHKLCYIKYSESITKTRREKVRPIPSSEQWFENVYNKFLKTNENK